MNVADTSLQLSSKTSENNKDLFQDNRSFSFMMEIVLYNRRNRKITVCEENNDK